MKTGLGLLWKCFVRRCCFSCSSSCSAPPDSAAARRLLSLVTPRPTLLPTTASASLCFGRVAKALSFRGSSFSLLAPAVRTLRSTNLLHISAACTRTGIVDISGKEGAASAEGEETDSRAIMSNITFAVEPAKTARSGCKECKTTIDKGALRLGKITPSPFSEDSTMTAWFHTACFFKMQMRSRATTKKLEDVADLDGFYALEEDERKEVKRELDKFVEAYAKQQAEKAKRAGKKKAKKRPADASSAPADTSSSSSASSTTTSGGEKAGTQLKISSKGVAYKPKSPTPQKAPATAVDGDRSDAGFKLTGKYASTGKGGEDDRFANFCKLCADVGAHPSYTDKTNLIKHYITRGACGKKDHKFDGDLYLVMRFLLPRNPKRVYNMQDKAFVKVFSSLLGVREDDMTADLDKGDCPETCATFFGGNTEIPPQKKSTLLLSDVENFLRRMEGLTTLDAQTAQFKRLLPKCTVNDVRFVMRLMKHDLRTFAGPKHVLGALDPKAYEAWQASHNLHALVERVKTHKTVGPGGSALKKALSVRASIMTAIKPMLAEACRTYDKALKKCPTGILAEIKYDGERVQIHKKGDRFEFFSRSLKQVSDHKIKFFKESVKQACPHGDSLILDAEVLMVDTKTSKPLPFGTLGIHKKQAFADAQPCLFIFDILHINGASLISEPLSTRRAALKKNVVEVKHEIMHSEQYEIQDAATLKLLMKRVMKEGLEGLVLKDKGGAYEPGKRHWLKMKKDYLENGSLADTADLVVLGAYYGTGTKGGVMSVFLMGCRDNDGKWRTVCKVGNGHTDEALETINKELAVKKISKDPAKVPSWLVINKKDLVPDFIVPDPKEAPVWEITGAELSESTSHSADGISIRFPRVTKVRDDKDWETATNLTELKHLYKTSKVVSDVATPFSAFAKLADAAADTTNDDDDDDGSDDGGFNPLKRRKKMGTKAPKATTTTDTASAKTEASVSSAKAPARKMHTAAATAATALKPKKGKAKRRGKRRSSEDDDDEVYGARDTDYELDGFVVADDASDDEDYNDSTMDEASDDDDDDDAYGSPSARKGKSRARRRDNCIYGARCYRKNPAHRRDFAHPADPDWSNDSDSGEDDSVAAVAVTATRSSATDSATGSLRSIDADDADGADDDDGGRDYHHDPSDGILPNIFSRVTAFVSKAQKDHAALFRYTVAFGGRCVRAADQAQDALSHILVPSLNVDEWDSDTKRAVAAAPSARIITFKWLWDSIKVKKALPAKDYSL